MKLSEHSQSTFTSERLPGVVWTYRQPGAAFGAFLTRKRIEGIPSTVIAKLQRRNADGSATGYDIADAIEKGDEDAGRIDVAKAASKERELALLAFRICIVGVTGIEDFDIQSAKTMMTEIGETFVRQLSDEAMELLDAGPVGQDIRQIGEMILAQSAQSDDQKKS